MIIFREPPFAAQPAELERAAKGAAGVRSRFCACAGVPVVAANKHSAKTGRMRGWRAEGLTGIAMSEFPAMQLDLVLKGAANLFGLVGREDILVGCPVFPKVAFCMRKALEWQAELGEEVG